MSFVHLPRTHKLWDAWWSFTHGIQHRLKYLPMQPETTDILLQLTLPYMESPEATTLFWCFDGEYNGLLSERAALAPQNITVTAGGLEPLKSNLFYNNSGLALTR